MILKILSFPFFLLLIVSLLITILLFAIVFTIRLWLSKSLDLTLRLTDYIIKALKED